ncbi:hypothetical protein RIN65_16850 [Pantoea agglomerans]|uniref:hypothetical protein n=1 Tax=Enterobacter agglomerans TaxID=549 RepID=UPI0028C4D41C|nr:hypothetical protein [Pantoea agglomerans]WNN34173.1 hypothetical protein RIN65_16850 [Pantoea agglomerans]
MFLDSPSLSSQIISAAISSHFGSQSALLAGEDRDRIKDVAYLVGEALTRAAVALPDNVLKEAPLL